MELQYLKEQRVRLVEYKTQFENQIDKLEEKIFLINCKFKVNQKVFNSYRKNKGIISRIEHYSGAVYVKYDKETVRYPMDVAFKLFKEDEKNV